MNFIIAACAGVALAAACGFRVFLPLLVAAVAARLHVVSPAGQFAWLGSATAITVLGVAAAAEVAAYYVPWLDHALDVIATPAAVAAGTLAMATTLPGNDPALRWALALIAGGGAAGVVQAGTVTARAASGATTAGLGNPVISTIEWAGAALLSVLALLVPVLAALLVVALILFAARQLIRWRRRARGQGAMA